MTPRERRTLLWVLGFLSFSSVYANVVIVPVLVEIASDFGTTAGSAGMVAGAYGLPGIAIAALSGPFSDRFGRKLFLVAGSVVMGVGTLLSAAAPTFDVLIGTRILAGVGAAVIFPNVNATVGDAFAYRERARAMSTVVAMNTMASIIGLPIGGIVAEATSWRLSVAGVGVLGIVTAFALLRLLPHQQPEVDRPRTRAVYRMIARDGSAIAAVLSSFLGGLFWFTWGTFYIVFFQRVYDLSLGTASTLGLTLGVGVLVGSQVGGRLGVRIGYRPIVGVSIVVAGSLVFAVTNVGMPLAVAAGLNLLLSAVIGARFSTNNALISEQVPSARGTLFSISSSLVSLAQVLGPGFGGILLDRYGFGAIGIFCVVVAIAGAAVLLGFVSERFDEEDAPL